MDQLFIEAYPDSSDSYFLDVDTLEIICTFRLVLPSINTIKLKLIIKLLEVKPNQPLISVDFTGIPYEIISDVSDIARYCKWPVIVKTKYVVAGLCAVARQLVKYSDDHITKQLLGFREACLMTCAENSIWTKFCEVDIIETAKDILNNKYHKNNKLTIPENITRFEFHMSKPVRMHNVYNVARKRNNNKELRSDIPLEDLNLDHCFSEGIFMTLADVILYPCFQIFFQKYSSDIFRETLPLTVDWFNNIKNKFDGFDLKLPSYSEVLFIEVISIPEFNKASLYKGDTTPSRKEKRFFTKQTFIDNAVQHLQSLKSTIVNNQLPFGYEVEFSWLNVPIEANPNGGALPEKRADRKCEQLENLTKAVVKLALDKNYKIVDFCSGSGHLGILLAIYLPKSEIILVENKERSLARAQETIKKLALQNVTMIQSNLDYFQGDFDIGVSLHACGVATDLVIQNCIDRKAHFVSCPCCYGGVKDCHHLSYPRSKEFQNLELGYSNFLNLAHAADQTHDNDNVKTKQGYLCMDVVDTDRRLYAESCGYEVHLGKLQPTSCTNKNNLLVGICNIKDIVC